MSEPFALQVTVELGERRRTLGPVELAAALAMPGLPGRLAALVLASPKSTAIHSDIHNTAEGGEPTEGKERPRVSIDTDKNGCRNESNSNSFSDPLPSKGVEASGGRCRREAKGGGAFGRHAGLAGADGLRDRVTEAVQELVGVRAAEPKVPALGTEVADGSRGRPNC